MFEKEQFLGGSLVGSGYIAMSDDKYAIVNSFIFLEIQRCRARNVSKENIEYLSFGHISLVRDTLASIPSWLVKEYSRNAASDCPRLSQAAVFCRLSAVLELHLAALSICCTHSTCAFRIVRVAPCARAKISSLHTR